MNINFIHEPDDLQCGQAVLAMILNRDVHDVAAELNNFRETKLSEMKNMLRKYDVGFCETRKEAFSKADLPELCILSLETPRCWHWSLYCDGTFYDPEHGVLDDFPVCKRKYYWEVYKK